MNQISPKYPHITFSTTGDEEQDDTIYQTLKDSGIIRGEAEAIINEVEALQEVVGYEAALRALFTVEAI